MRCEVCEQNFAPHDSDERCPRCVRGSKARFAPTMADARERRIVRLADGRVGRLVGVTARTRRVNVHVNGRFLRFPADDVVAFEA